MCHLLRLFPVILTLTSFLSLTDCLFTRMVFTGRELSLPLWMTDFLEQTKSADYSIYLKKVEQWLQRISSIMRAYITQEAVTAQVYCRLLLERRTLSQVLLPMHSLCCFVPRMSIMRAFLRNMPGLWLRNMLTALGLTSSPLL